MLSWVTTADFDINIDKLHSGNGALRELRCGNRERGPTFEPTGAQTHRFPERVSLVDVRRLIQEAERLALGVLPVLLLLGAVVDQARLAMGDWKFLDEGMLSFLSNKEPPTVGDSMRSIIGQELGSFEVAHDEWVLASGIDQHHRSAHVRRVLCRALQFGAQYHGINVKKSTVFEYVTPPTLAGRSSQRGSLEAEF